MSEELKQLVNSGAGTEQFKKMAISQGLKPLRANGLNLVLKGQTTIEEVFRCTVE